MNILSYIFPQEIYRDSSKYSQDIRVIVDCGRTRLLVNGIEQTGKYIDRILKQGFAAFRATRNNPVNHILMLGVGGGSLIRMFRKEYPHASIDAVDIDPAIIHVAQTYFDVIPGPLFSLHTVDAREYVNRPLSKQSDLYDVVIIDLYIGREIPDFVWERPFLTHVRKLLAAHGSIFINVVHDGKFGTLVKQLERNLRNLHLEVRLIPIDYNTIFIVTS